MLKPALAALVAVVLGGPALAQGGAPTGKAHPIAIVAAESVYGDVAQQIGGPGVSVVSVLSNPDQDPHLFEASPSVARELSTASIVIYNGAGYDPWIEKLLAAAPQSARKAVAVADLVHRQAGENPHLWYDPATMPMFARALATALAELDPERRAAYEQRLKSFLDSTRAINAEVVTLKRKYTGIPVSATEPVFGYMAEAIGLRMHEQGFQRAVMNDTEPSASDVAGFEDDLKQKKVRLLIYNSQATDAAAKRLLSLAKRERIPVVGVTETLPKGITFQEWMLAQLYELDRALLPVAH